MDGDIGLRSKEGCGTTVFIVVPLLVGGSSTVELCIPSHPIPCHAKPGFFGIRILSDNCLVSELHIKSDRQIYNITLS